MAEQPHLIEIAFSKTLEKALNTAMALDEENALEFASLQGKVVALKVKPLEPTFFCLINDNISIQQNLVGAADCYLQTDISDWLNLAVEQNFKAEITEGDHQVAESFIKALQQLEIDWEEILSQYTGDLFAFKIGHGVRSVLAKKNQAKQQAGDTLKEYLQFEINALPTQSQVNHFIADIPPLETAVNDIEQRIQKLQRVINNDSI